MINGIFEGVYTIVNFILEMRQIDVQLRKGSLMIHCNKCQNRSGIVVIGYVMAKTNSSFRDANWYVQQLRPSICVEGVIPNGKHTGREFLERYEDDIRNCLTKHNRVIPLPQVVSDQEWHSILFEDTAWMGSKRLDELALTRWPSKFDKGAGKQTKAKPVKWQPKAVFDQEEISADSRDARASGEPHPGPPPVTKEANPAELQDRVDTTGRAKLKDADG